MDYDIVPVIWKLLYLIFYSIALVIIPVLYRVPSFNMYHYIEMRFQSKLLRAYAVLLFTFSTLTYMAVVLYTPAAALAPVVGFPDWQIILVIGGVCTLYTSLGGLKAVVWTDAFQAVVMYAGTIALVVKGILAVGGIRRVYEITLEGGRLQGLWNIDPDPLQYATLWTLLFGGAAHWLLQFGANQMALQRYCSLPSVRHAQYAALLNIPAMLIVGSLVTAIGLIMFAYYAYCDPLHNPASGVVNGNGLVIDFMLRMFEKQPGLPGLYLACVFSGTLSTVSSGINSLAAVVWAEITVHHRGPIPAQGAWIRLAATVFGAAGVGLAFAVKPLGGIIQVATTAIGAIGGPLLGLILLGILCPAANHIGALVSAIFASAVTLWICLGQAIHKPFNAYQLPTTTQCCNPNVTCVEQFAVNYFNFTQKAKNSDWGLDTVYSLSGMCLVLLGCLIVLILGALMAICIRNEKQEEVMRHSEIPLHIWTSSSKIPVNNSPNGVTPKIPSRNGHIIAYKLECD